MSGSTVVGNLILEINERGVASPAYVDDGSLNSIRLALSAAKASPSPSEHNITFLTAWLTNYERGAKSHARFVNK